MNAVAPSRAPRVLRGAIVAVTVLLLLVVLFEVAARALPIEALSMAKLDPIAANLKNSRIGPHPYLAYAVRPDFVLEPSAKQPLSIRHNSLGFRGRETTWEKPAGTYRIVCLGGSSTYGFGPSSNETNWTERLEVHLNEAQPGKTVEVINAGCQGYSTFESLINLELRAIDFRPDLVIVYLTINDMRCVLYPNVAHDNTHWRAVWPTARKEKLLELLESSRTYLAWRRYCTDWFVEQSDMGTWLIRDFGKYADDFLQPTDVELGYANYGRNLVSIINVAHAHGAEVLLVPEATRMGDFERFGSKDIQRDAYARLCAIEEQIAVERSVPFTRSARSVLEAEAARQAPEYVEHPKVDANGKPMKDGIFTNEVHMTDAGCDLLAKTLADAILGMKLVR